MTGCAAPPAHPRPGRRRPQLLHPDEPALAADGGPPTSPQRAAASLPAAKPGAPQSALTAKATAPTRHGLHASANVSPRSGYPTRGAAPAAFAGRRHDGTEAFFTSTEKLTDDANTGPEQTAAGDRALRRRRRHPGEHEKLHPTHADAVAVDANTSTGPNPARHDRARAKLEDRDRRRIHHRGRSTTVVAVARRLHLLDQRCLRT